jgi:hypothetical protein
MGGQNAFPSIGVTPSSPAPPQSPVVPQMSGGGGIGNMNMFGGMDGSSPQMGGGGGSGGQNPAGVDPRLLPPGMSMNSMNPHQRQQLMMLQQQASTRGAAGTPVAGQGAMGMNMGGGAVGMGGGPNMGGGMGGGAGGMGNMAGNNPQNMMGMMTPQQQLAIAQEQRMREQRQQQMNMAMNMPPGAGPSNAGGQGGVNPQMMSGPSIARSARSPTEGAPNMAGSPMAPRMAQQPGAAMRGNSMGQEEYARLMQQQAMQAQRALSARSPANFPQQQQPGAGGGGGGWQGQQQGMGMNMGGGGMGGMGMNPQQQQNPSGGYGMSSQGNAGPMYSGAGSPTGNNQGPMWSSTAGGGDPSSQMSHMPSTPNPQQMQSMGMMDSGAMSNNDFDLFSSWTQ